MFLNRLKQYTAVSTLALLPFSAIASTGTISYQVSYVSQFGSGGNGNGQFNTPESISIGPDNKLYVADRYNNRVQVFSINGTYETQFYSGFGTTSVAHSGGRIFVALSSESRIAIFDGSYNQIGNLATSGNGDGQVQNPEQLIVAPNGNIFVTDNGNSRIQVFAPDGTFITKFGSNGGGPGQFQGVYDIAFAANGNLYITDTYNQRVQIFDSSYNAIGVVGLSDGSADSYQRPVGISIDATGNIYVVDFAKHRFQIYSPTGTLLVTYGANGTGNGQFNEPLDVVMLANGNFFITDKNNNRIQTLNLLSNEVFSSSPVGGNETATTPNAAVELTGTGTFANSFVGYNGLVMNGTEWTLSGASSFGQAVAVNTGLLTVDGTLTAPTIAIANGAALGGTGTLSGAVENSGLITPANNNIGTLNVTGTYTSAPTSTYQVDVDDAGNSDRISVTGNAVLNGGAVSIVAVDGNYAANTNYTILSTTTGYTGTLGTVTSNLAFLTPTLNYVGNNVILNLVNTDAVTPGGGLDFNPYASSGNEQAVANTLSAYTAEGLGGDTEALNAMTVFNTSEAAQFLSQSTPNETSSIPQVQTSIVSQMVQPLQQRMNSLRNDDISGISSGDQLTERNMWVETLGGFANQDTKGNNNGYRTSITGMRGGLDKAYSNNTTLGLSVGYGVGTTSFDQGTDRAQSKYTHVDMYAQHQRNGVIVEGIVGAGGGEIETTRFITAGGLNRAANGSTQAYDLTALAKVSQPIALKREYTLIPSVTAQASWQRQNSFSETGAGGLNLSFNDTTTTPVILTPMVHVQKTFESKEHGYKLTPTIGAGPSWQLTDRESSTIAGFSSASSAVPQFRVTGLKQDALAMNIQAGVTLEPFGKAQYVPSVSINANSKLSNTASAHSANLNLNWKW